MRPYSYLFLPRFEGALPPEFGAARKVAAAYMLDDAMMAIGFTG